MDTKQEYPPHQGSPGSWGNFKRPDGGAKLGSLVAGRAHYDALPPPVQERLLKRIDKDRNDQFAIDTSLSGSKVVLCFLPLVFLGGVVTYGFSDRWKGSTEFWMGILVLVAALIQIALLMSAWKHVTSKLKDWLVITPIYIIKTSGNEVSFWPLWTLSKLNGTAEYVNGMYSITHVKMEFGSGPRYEDIDFQSKHGYTRIVETLNAFETALRLAIQSSDWVYLRRQDDFREYTPDDTYLPKPDSSLRVLITSACVLAVYIAAYIIAWQANATLPVR